MNEQFVGGVSPAGAAQAALSPASTAMTDEQRKKLAQMLLMQGLQGNQAPGAVAPGGMAFDQSGAAFTNGAAGIMGAYLQGMGGKK